MACSTGVRIPAATGMRARVPELAAWLLVAVGVAVGLAPQSLAGFVFGH
jgi:hypothetical protein